MDTNSRLKMIALITCVISVRVCRGDEVHVSHTGSDQPGCGPSTQPCATLHHALSSHPNASHITVNSSGGAYLSEAGSQYLVIDHNVTLTGSGPGPAVIQCPDDQHSKLFYFVASSAGHHVVVSIENLSIRNCRGNKSSVMRLLNATLKLSDSEFVNNGVLLSHSQIAADNCSSISVIIFNCVFNNDLDSRPFYRPGVTLAGCQFVRLKVTSSTFRSAPVMVTAELHGHVRLRDVRLSGVAVRGSSLAITLGPGDNLVSLKDCNVSGHEASHSSAVSISTDSSPRSSDVELRRVRFHDNGRQKTRGAALSILARFERQSRPQLNTTLYDCVFYNNSAAELQVGGAMYVANADTVRLFRCQFERNAANDGGAVYVHSSTGIQLIDCIFTDNSAASRRQTSYASRGGALFAVSSQLQLIDTNFINNTARYSGSAMFVEDSTGVSLNRCVFTESQSAGHLPPGPDGAVLSLSAVRPAQSASAVIKLTDCRVQSSLPGEHLLVSVRGPTSINNSSVSCQSDAMSLHHASLPSAQYQAGYQLRQLSVWSQSACDAGYYRSPSNDACHLALDRLADLNDSVQLCYACPAHAHCQDAVVHADYNYYVVTRTDGPAEVMLCPAGFCQPRNSTRPCSDGRTGGMCRSCDENHVPSLHFNDYISCESDNSACIGYSSASAAIVCFTFIYVIALLLMLRLATRQNHHTTSISADASHVTITRRSLIGCVFPLVYFYQLLPSVYPRLMTSSSWTDRVVQFFTSLFHLYPAAFAAGRGFCLGELTAQSSSLASQRYFFTMSVYWSHLGLIALLFCTLAAVFLFNRGPFTEQNIKALVSYFLPAFLFFQLFSNVPLLRASLQSVDCVAFNGSSVLYDDAATFCYAPWQIFAVLYVVVCVAPLCLVVDTTAFLLSRGRASVPVYLCVCLLPLLGLVAVPVGNLRATRRGRCRETRDEFEVDETTPEGLRTVSTHSVVVVQSVLIKPFSGYWSSSVVDVGWMTVILVRNCIICMLSSLLHQEPSTRAILVTAACLCFTVDHLVCRAYSLTAANWLDAASWLMLTLLGTFDIYVSVVYEAGHSLDTWSAVDWLARLVTSLPLIVIVVVVVVLISLAVFRRVTRTLPH